MGDTIDSYSANGDIAAEYRAEQTYFQKPKAEIAILTIKSPHRRLIGGF